MIIVAIFQCYDKQTQKSSKKLRSPKKNPSFLPPSLLSFLCNTTTVLILYRNSENSEPKVNNIL